MGEPCYKKKTINGTTQVYNVSGTDTVCPGSATAAGYHHCCDEDSICLEQGICQSPDPKVGASGYYMGSCTDPLYMDLDACPQFCTNLHYAAITYNYTSDLWNCCGADGNGQIKCSNPTKYTSLLPPPDVLLSAYSASIATTTATTTGTARSSATTQSSVAASTTVRAVSATVTPDTVVASGASSSSMSAGTKAAIGLGVVFGVVAVVAFVFLVLALRRIRKQRQPPPEYSETVEPRSDMQWFKLNDSKDEVWKHGDAVELGDRDPKAELTGEQVPETELPGEHEPKPELPGEHEPKPELPGEDHTVYHELPTSTT